MWQAQGWPIQEVNNILSEAKWMITSHPGRFSSLYWDSAVDRCRALLRKLKEEAETANAKKWMTAKKRKPVTAKKSIKKKPAAPIAAKKAIKKKPAAPITDNL